MLKEYLARIGKVALGQIISGVGIVLMLQANIGTDTWNTLHTGISIVTGISLGMVTVLVGATAIAAAMLLGERIGIGTIVGVTLPGFVIDILLGTGVIPRQTSFLPGLVMLLAGLEVLTIGTWLYMSQCLGSGPRDALNVALARKVPFSVGACRSAIELAVTLAGWLMGGTVGVGTILSALAVGVLFQVNFKLLRFDPTGLEQENLADTWRRVRSRLARGKERASPEPSRTEDAAPAQNPDI